MLRLPIRDGSDETAQIEKRFWAKVQMGDPDDCWLWLGTKNGKGYGQIRIWDRAIGTHRVSYSLHFGMVDEGKCVLHSCDNPSCVNPSHLLMGTHADNCADKIAKNRLPRGVDTSMAKLTESQVREIRRRNAEEGIGWRRLSREYGVSGGCVAAVILRKSWAHL